MTNNRLICDHFPLGLGGLGSRMVRIVHQTGGLLEIGHNLDDISELREVLHHDRRLVDTCRHLLAPDRGDGGKLLFTH